MSSFLVPPGGKIEIPVAANDRIAIYSSGACTLEQILGFPNYPEVSRLVSEIPAYTEFASTAFTAAGTVVIDNSSNPFSALFEVGTDAIIKDDGRKAAPVQGDPVAVNVTGAVSAAAILGGIVTSTTAAAVAGTIPTGTVMDAAADFAINDSVEWVVINTGGTNAFTVTAAAGHTIVGAAAVAALTSGRFRTRKTAANTFVTYRV